MKAGWQETMKVPPRISAAVRFFRKAARMGKPAGHVGAALAQMKSSRRATVGKGVAALQGLAEAQDPLAERLYARELSRGVHVPQDEEAARRYLARSAQHGNRVAKEMMIVAEADPSRPIHRIDDLPIAMGIADRQSAVSRKPGPTRGG